MDVCPLCFENMDMVGYQDERQNTVECYKLDCGHAYHTACIISCLTQLNRKCPQCNTQKDPTRELTREALAAKLIRELKRHEQVKPLIDEFKEIKEEQSEAVKQLKNDIKEYAKKRAEELRIPEKRKYLMDCQNELQRTAKAVAKQKGDKYIGALREVLDNNRRGWGSSFTRAFFGREAAYTIYRLKFPRLYLELW